MLRKIVFMLFVSMSFMFTASAFAEGEASSNNFTPIEYYDFDFKMQRDGDKVSFTWNTFPVNKNFKWYKFLYSTDFANPSYPEHPSEYLGDDISRTSHSITLKSGEKNHYFRLCVVTQDTYTQGRHCTKTKKLELSLAEVRESKENATQVSEKKTETVSSKEEIKESAPISSSLKNRIDVLLEDFISRLKDRNYSEDQIVETIDIVLERLEKYKQDETYSGIISYMEEVLLEYRAIYDDPLGDLEDVFSDL